MSEVRKTYELGRHSMGGSGSAPVPHELDLSINWETFECPSCGGTGSCQGDPEFGDDDWYDCDECGGTGELAIAHDSITDN